MRNVSLFVVLGLLAGWCAAENDESPIPEPPLAEEVVVEVPFTAVATELKRYGIVRVRYRSTAAGYDEVAIVEQTREIPAAASAFGVELAITAKPPRELRIAEVWSHPKIRHRRSPDRHAHTVHLHKIHPPDVYSFYFPFYEYSTSPDGEWMLQLFLMEDLGPGGQNVELDQDPARFIASVARPFFEYQFNVQPE